MKGTVVCGPPSAGTFTTRSLTKSATKRLPALSSARPLGWSSPVVGTVTWPLPSAGIFTTRSLKLSAM